jgi:hypothetical protein
MRAWTAAVSTAAVMAVAGAAEASEVWLGAYAHDVEDGLSIGHYEDGAQVAAGVIGRPLERLRRIGRPSPYALAAVNTDGGTNYAAAGVSWRLNLRGDGRVYLRPGVGLAVHDGDIDHPSPYETGITSVEQMNRFRRGRQEIDLGSRVLFQPELALGWRVNERVALEASWLHISHGQLFGGQNPGLSDLGIRLVYGFGPS